MKSALNYRRIHSAEFCVELERFECCVELERFECCVELERFECCVELKRCEFAWLNLRYLDLHVFASSWKLLDSRIEANQQTHTKKNKIQASHSHEFSKPLKNNSARGA